MGRNKKPQKRILSEQGWLYYCSMCEGYKPETEFNQDKNRPFGVYYICKEHRKQNYNKVNNIDPNDNLNHIKLVFVTEQDEQMKHSFLSNMGYNTNTDKSVHQQFMDKIEKRYGKTL